MTKLLIPVVLLCWCLFQSSPWNKHLSIFSICRKDFSPPGNAEMALWGWKTTLKNDAVWLFSSYWSGRDLVSTGKDGATKLKSQRTTCCVSWSERSCFAQKVHVLERTKPRATVRKLLLLRSKIKQEFTWQSPFHTQVCGKEAGWAEGVNLSHLVLFCGSCMEKGKSRKGKGTGLCDLVTARLQPSQHCKTKFRAARVKTENI